MTNREFAKEKLSYKIFISKDFGLFHKSLSKFEIKNKKILILTDTKLKSIYSKEIGLLIPKKCNNETYIYAINSGDKNKNLKTCEKVYKLLIDNDFSRNDVIIAFGGGMVSDLAGFVAATYMRGISFINIPTTLLSMCDSCIGGKTAVNIFEIKNTIGSFKNPKFVYINLMLLRTLKDADFNSGLVEVIKHGLISDAKFFDFIVKNKEKIQFRNFSIIKYLVKKSLAIKTKFIINDPYDLKERRLLNFGHTFGHAIEAKEKFKITHGRCIAIGMRMAMELTSFKDTYKVISLLNYFGIDTDYAITNKAIMLSLVKKDKKCVNGKLEFICLKRIGKAYIKELIV